MSRSRDHYPRFDTTICPDLAGCARLHHFGLLLAGMGDCPCECCGGDVLEVALDPIMSDGQVVYWRVRQGGQGIGAVSKVEKGWRAARGFHPAQVHLGVFARKLAAFDAVILAPEPEPGRCDCSESRCKMARSAIHVIRKGRQPVASRPPS